MYAKSNLHSLIRVVSDVNNLSEIGTVPLKVGRLDSLGVIFSSTNTMKAIENTLQI